MFKHEIVDELPAFLGVLLISAPNLMQLDEVLMLGDRIERLEFRLGQNPNVLVLPAHDLDGEALTTTVTC